MEKDALRMRISQTLIRLGVPMDLRGYEFLREAILLVHIDREMPMKAVYTKVAATFGVTAETVRRGCRSAVTRAFASGCLAHFDSYLDAPSNDSDPFILLTARELLRSVP